MRLKRTDRKFYDEDDVLLCPVARDFPWRDGNDDALSPFTHEYVCLRPRLSTDDALAIAEQVSFAA